MAPTLNRVIRLQRRVREHPDDIQGWCELAAARLEMGERAEAVSDAAQAAELALTAPEGWLDVGTCWRRLDELARAREAFKAACAHDPLSARPHLELGRTVLAEGRADVAATVLATAVWLAPESPDARVAMGRALMVLDNHAQAEEHLMEARRLAPDAPEPWLALADLFEKRREREAKLEALKKAYGLDPRDPQVGIRLARALQTHGRNEAAYTVLEAVLSRDPSNPTVLVEMGRIEMALGRLDAATSTFRRAARTDGGGDATGSMYLGIALLALHRESDAVAALREARRQRPEDPEIAYHLGEALWAIDEVGEALSVVAQATLIDRDDVRLQELLSRLCADDESADASGSVDMAPERALVSVASRSSEMAFTGDLGQFNLIDLLEFLRLNRRTGYLRLVSLKGVGEIMLVEGRLVGATTTNIGRLGDLLIKRGSLSQDSLDSAVEAQRLARQRTPLGRLLMDQGRLTTKDLRSALETQVQQTIADVLSWGEGQFAFEADDGVRDTVAHPDLELDTGSIMLEVLRLMDEGETF